MYEYTFVARLTALLGADLIIAIADSYVPHDWTLARIAIGTVQLGFMAATMAVAVRRVLQDY
jgi:hypothetical protein